MNLVTLQFHLSFFHSLFSYYLVEFIYLQYLKPKIQYYIFSFKQSCLQEIKKYASNNKIPEQQLKCSACKINPIIHDYILIMRISNFFNHLRGQLIMKQRKENAGQPAGLTHLLPEQIFSQVPYHHNQGPSTDKTENVKCLTYEDLFSTF